VNRKAETVCRKNREIGMTDFRSAAVGIVHAAIAIGQADHPLGSIYDAIRDDFQAKSRAIAFGRGFSLFPLAGRGSSAAVPNAPGVRQLN
jgi:hypothetical protein